MKVRPRLPGGGNRTAAPAVVLAMFCAALTAGGATFLDTARPAFAQSPQATGTISLGTIFDGEETDPTPQGARDFVDAATKAGAPGQCPKARVTVVVEQGDPLFQQALAVARSGVLLGILDRAGLGANRFLFEIDINGARSEVKIDYDAWRDRDKPRLDTNSVPPKGSKVKAGDRIDVTMTASDDANTWQSGIRFIRLSDDTAQAVVGFETYERAPEGCTQLPPKRTLERTYTVPPDPPPVIRLRAVAEDHAGNSETDTGSFPTQGDWYGRIEWTYHGKEDRTRLPNQNRAETKYDGYADLLVNSDGQGNLTGTLSGSQKVDILWWGYPHGSGEVCRGSAPPTAVRARILGADTPGRQALSLQLLDLEAKVTATWSGGGPNLRCTPVLPIDSGPVLESMVSAPQAVDDDTYRVEFKTSEPLLEVRYTFTLRRIGN